MHAPELCDVGLIGLAVMGRNLALNMADHGFRVAVYNRTSSVTEAFAEEFPNESFVPTADGHRGAIIPCNSIDTLLGSLRSPRVLIVLVKAGPAVDAVCQQLIDAGADPEDIVVDAGNSLWTDTIRREREYRGRLTFFGSGVSGGETGARFGPSLMPGGDLDAWQRLRPVWEAIAAKVDPETGRPIEQTSGFSRTQQTGEPCAAYIGSDGAGHYVKMVHNGIEYADMQLIAEASFLLRSLLGLEPDTLAEIFSEWNTGELDSYLIEITAEILRQRDPAKPHAWLIDSILDAAGQKGTGKWTSVNALDMGVPAPTIAEAVFARCASALKTERETAARELPASDYTYDGGQQQLIEAVRDGLYCSKVCAYAQGFALMQAAEREYGWTLNLAEIARIWRGGCIIRARFLQTIAQAFTLDTKLPNLLLDETVRRTMKPKINGWRQVVRHAAGAGIPVPAFMSALAYYDTYRTASGTAALIQAQRDYFGAHTFERIDQPRGTFFHIDWPHPDRPQHQVD